MAMPFKDRPQFLKQTGEWFAATRRAAKAAGKFITYSLEDLQSLVERHFADSHCPYCRGPLGVGQFTLDHKNPLLAVANTFSRISRSVARNAGI